MKTLIILLLLITPCFADTPEIVDYSCKKTPSLCIPKFIDMYWAIELHYSRIPDGMILTIYMDVYGNFYINGVLEKNPKKIVEAFRKWGRLAYPPEDSDD